MNEKSINNLPHAMCKAFCKVVGLFFISDNQELVCALIRYILDISAVFDEHIEKINLRIISKMSFDILCRWQIVDYYSEFSNILLNENQMKIIERSSAHAL